MAGGRPATNAHFAIYKPHLNDSLAEHLMTVSISELSQQIGRLSGQQEAMKSELDDVRRDVKAIRAALDQIEGGRKVALWIFAVFGSLVGGTAGVLGTKLVGKL